MNWAYFLRRWQIERAESIGLLRPEQRALLERLLS